jgi:predicted ester cyclase
MPNLLDSENKKLITEYFEALSGKPKTAVTVAKYVADESLAKHIAESEAAFPDYLLIPQEIIAENDLVVVRAEFKGVHRGPFAGIPPTGKSVSAGLIIIYKVQNGKIVNHWMQFDALSVLQQLQNPQDNVALVTKQLEAFGRRDMEALLDNCSNDIEICAPGPDIIPFCGMMKGKEQSRRYFEQLINTQTGVNLNVSQMLAQGNTVVVLATYSAQVKSTGKTITTPLSLTFELSNGKIAKYAPIGDTAALAAGYTKTSAATP